MYVLVCIYICIYIWKIHQYYISSFTFMTSYLIANISIYVCIHTYVLTLIILSIACSIFECMFSGLTFGTVKFPWRSLFLLLSAFLTCLWFFVQGWGFVVLPLSTLIFLPFLSLFSSHFHSHVDETFAVLASGILKGHNLRANFLVLWFWQSFCPVINIFWSLGVGIVLYMYHWE